MISDPLPFCHVPLNGKQHTTAEVARMLKDRRRAKNILCALLDASGGRIYDLDGGDDWASADIRFLRVNWCLRFVRRRIDGAALLEITDEGREVLALVLG